MQFAITKLFTRLKSGEWKETSLLKLRKKITEISSLAIVMSYYTHTSQNYEMNILSIFGKDKILRKMRLECFVNINIPKELLFYDSRYFTHKASAILSMLSGLTPEMMKVRKGGQVHMLYPLMNIPLF